MSDWLNLKKFVNVYSESGKCKPTSKTSGERSICLRGKIRIKEKSL